MCDIGRPVLMDLLALIDSDTIAKALGAEVVAVEGDSAGLRVILPGDDKGPISNIFWFRRINDNWCFQWRELSE